jgi:hypothetical protein
LLVLSRNKAKGSRFPRLAGMTGILEAGVVATPLFLFMGLGKFISSLRSWC